MAFFLPNSIPIQYTHSYFLRLLFLLLPHIRSLCPAHLILLNLIILIITGEVTSYEAPHYAFFSALLQIHPSSAQYYPQHTVLKHSQSVFFFNTSTRNSVSHQCRITSKIISAIFDSRPEEKKFLG
jgi:hypothetical protein